MPSITTSSSSGHAPPGRREPIKVAYHGRRGVIVEPSWSHRGPSVAPRQPPAASPARPDVRPPSTSGLATTTPVLGRSRSPGTCSATSALLSQSTMSPSAGCGTGSWSPTPSYPTTAGASTRISTPLRQEAPTPRRIGSTSKAPTTSARSAAWWRSATSTSSLTSTRGDRRRWSTATKCAGRRLTPPLCLASSRGLTRRCCVPAVSSCSASLTKSTLVPGEGSRSMPYGRRSGPRGG